MNRRYEGQSPYQWADAELRKHPRTVNRRKLANNTYLVRLDEERIAVCLHSTYVLTFHRDGWTEYRTGGWFTVTTKDRMSSYGPADLLSERGTWYFRKPNGANYWEKGHPYFDGARVSSGGEILNPQEAPSDAEIRERDNLKSKIRAFAFFATIQWERGMKFPNAGDCFFCSFPQEAKGDHVARTTSFNGAENVVTEGEPDVSHLLAHIEERYVPSALLWNAVAAAGYPHPEIILGCDGNGNMGGNRNRHFADTIRRSLRKYLGNRLVGVGVMR